MKARTKRYGIVLVVVRTGQTVLSLIITHLIKRPGFGGGVSVFSS